jgi:hypothetical protein
MVPLLKLRRNFNFYISVVFFRIYNSFYIIIIYFFIAL